MVAEAGNIVSSSVFQKLGFQEAANVRYADFAFEGKKPFSSLQSEGFQSLTMFKRSITSDLYV